MSIILSEKRKTVLILNGYKYGFQKHFVLMKLKDRRATKIYVKPT